MPVFGNPPVTNPVSTIPTVKGYLYDQLTQRPELAAPVGIFYDTYGDYMPDDRVIVGDVRRTVKISSMVGSGGAGWLEENYQLQVRVEVYRGGDTPRVTFERAFALADVVIDVVRLDPSLAGRVIRASPTQSEAVSGWADNNLGRVTEITVDIDVLARI